jgi:hypothetical protein
MYTEVHASSGIRTHDPSVRADKDSSCLTPTISLSTVIIYNENILTEMPCKMVYLRQIVI